PSDAFGGRNGKIRSPGNNGAGHQRYDHKQCRAEYKQKPGGLIRYNFFFKKEFTAIREGLQQAPFSGTGRADTVLHNSRHLTFAPGSISRYAKGRKDDDEYQHHFYHDKNPVNR